MTSITSSPETAESPPQRRKLVLAIGRAIAAAWRALPRVEPITGPFEDGPGERSVIINGRRVMYPRQASQEPGKG